MPPLSARKTKSNPQRTSKPDNSYITNPQMNLHKRWHPPLAMVEARPFTEAAEAIYMRPQRPFGKEVDAEGGTATGADKPAPH